MREVTITAPRSKRQTEKDPGEPGHSQPRMSTEDRSPHISAISPSPSQQEKEGGPSWGAHGQRVGVPEDPGLVPELQQAPDPGSATHTRHSNGTQRHTKTHVHKPWQCTKSRYYLNCWATGNCNYVQFPHKLNFLTRAMLQKKLSLKRKEKLWRICSILNFHHLWHEIYIQQKMMKTQRLISLCSQGSFSLSAHRFTLQIINQCDSMSHKQSLKMCAIRFV